MNDESVFFSFFVLFSNSKKGRVPRIFPENAARFFALTGR